MKQYDKDMLYRLKYIGYKGAKRDPRPVDLSKPASYYVRYREKRLWLNARLKSWYRPETLDILETLALEQDVPTDAVVYAAGVVTYTSMSPLSPLSDIELKNANKHINLAYLHACATSISESYGISHRLWPKEYEELKAN
jgi:hypothetical protein